MSAHFERPDRPSGRFLFMRAKRFKTRTRIEGLTIADLVEGMRIFDFIGRLFRLLRRLILPEACAPAQARAQGNQRQVTWLKGDPHCGQITIEGVPISTIKHNGLFIAFDFVEVEGLYIAAVMVTNGSDRRVLVNPRLSLLSVWEDASKEPYERLAPMEPETAAGAMSAALTVKQLAPKESAAGELYFPRKKFEAGFFVLKIEDVFYQFIITPARKLGKWRRHRHV